MKEELQIAIEISMYPFISDYEGPILAFIKHLNTFEGIQIKTNAMSTQLFGSYDLVMDGLKIAMKESFSKELTSVMVLKVLNLDLQSI